MIVTVANRKGGVGKTATAQALGAGLIKRGYKVLYIDLDSQSNLTNALGIDSRTIEASSLEVLEGSSNASEAIISTDRGDILPASPDLAKADRIIEGTGSEYRLKEELQNIAGRYDFVIIDTPPALGILVINALTASEKVIIPAQADLYSLQGIEQLYGAVETVRRYTNKSLTIAGVLLTRYTPRSIISQDMKSNLSDLAEQIGSKLYQAQIREGVAVREAQATQTDILTYDPKSNPASDYEAFIKEFLEEATK